jgi:dolichol-phosphate mannosyltransferase
MRNIRIVVLGATGFVGSNVFKYLMDHDFEVRALVRDESNWRLDEIMRENSEEIKDNHLEENLDSLSPDIVLNFVANGGYSFQDNFNEMIYANFMMVDKVANWCSNNNSALIHFGSSSEYGLHSAGPLETEKEIPNSYYSITKLGGTHLLAHHHARSNLKAVVLRLYSAYGPKEDPSRLLPNLIKGSFTSNWPNFTDLDVSRDFIYVDDVSRLVVKVIEHIHKLSSFEIFNVGTGVKTTLGDLASICEREFNMPKVTLGYRSRDWDLSDWYANIDKAKNILGWNPEYNILAGINKMRSWYSENDRLKYLSAEYSIMETK